MMKFTLLGGNQRRKTMTSTENSDVVNLRNSLLSERSKSLKSNIDESFEQFLCSEKSSSNDVEKTLAGSTPSFGSIIFQRILTITDVIYLVAARKYLFNVPHENKLKFNATKRVLNDSVTSLQDFDPCGASKAFGCLMKYALNLYLQPWRKDFTRIEV